MEFGRTFDRSMGLSPNFKGPARHWIVQRRRGLVRGIYYRLVANDRSSGDQILAEVQW